MNVQLWSAIAVVMLGYIVGFYFQHRDTDNVNRRIDDLRAEMNGRLVAIDKRLDDLKDWMRSEFKRLEERIERIEHPVVRAGG